MNFTYLQRALEFYQQHNYVYMEDAPWVVSKEAALATKPQEANEILLQNPLAGVQKDHRHLVASGEQSFLQMMLDDRQIKRAVCLTPCYRDEATTNHWKHPYFMKVELIRADDPSPGNLAHMISHAVAFFEQFVRVKVVQTGPDAFDILEQSLPVELGSYGIREVTFPEKYVKDRKFKWIYGTGCAEPRLSSAVTRSRKSPA